MSKSNKQRSDYWEEKVNDYKKSEIKISQSKWCKENNLSFKKFNYWYCKFKKNDKENEVTDSNCKKNDKQNDESGSSCSKKAKENTSKNSNSSQKQVSVNNRKKWIPIIIEDIDTNTYQDKDKNISSYEDKNKIGIIINMGKAKIEMLKGFDNQSLLEVLKVVNLLC